MRCFDDTRYTCRHHTIHNINFMCIYLLILNVDEFDVSLAWQWYISPPCFLSLFLRGKHAARFGGLVCREHHSLEPLQKIHPTSRHFSQFRVVVLPILRCRPPCACVFLLRLPPLLESKLCSWRIVASISSSALSLCFLRLKTCS